MDNRGISKLELKKINRMQILKVIRKEGPISRVDIACVLQITRAAVTIITNEMIEEGVLYEVGEAPVLSDNLQKGRRKILIDINPDFKFTFGVSINESSISVGLSNIKPKVIDKSFINYTDDMSCDSIISYIADETQKIMQKNKIDSDKLLGMGVSIQPELCSKMKIYFKDGKLDFNAFSRNLKKKVNMPVVCMNLINALALTNQELNTDYRTGNYIFLKFGSSINMSVLIENKVMHEYMHHTNQIERAICKPNGAKLNGFPDGSVKAELTKGAVAAKYAAILSKTDTPVLWNATDGKPENITEKTVMLAVSKNETKVLEVLHDIMNSISIIINNFSTALNARYVILHNFSNEWFFEYFKKFVSERYGDDLARKLRISRSQNHMEFTGGCAIAIYEFFYNTGGCQQ